MNLRGVLAPIPTPFDENESVDTERLRRALARWLTTPLSGFVVLGSNGEAPYLDESESDRVIAAAREAIPSHRPLIAGTGRESTRAAARASRRAAELGADAVIVRTPGFFRTQMTDDALVRHYSIVADASPVPVLLYNFTAVTGVDLSPAAVARLAGHPNVIGMKESGGDIAKIGQLVDTTPESFTVLAGSASTFYAALCLGAAGGVLAIASVVPQACARLYEAATMGRHDEARSRQRQIVPLARLLGPVYGVAGLKAALNAAGWDIGIPRGPLAPLPDGATAAVCDVLDRFDEISLVPR
jgi:4-hydroxy-2-oxoglutarate aldolase